MKLKIIFALCLGVCTAASAVRAQQSSEIEPDDTIHFPAFDLPESSFLSQATRQALWRDRNVYAKEQDERTAACPPIDLPNKAKMPAIRQCLAEKFYKSSLYRTMQADFPTRMEPKVIAGVYTDVFTPASGVGAENRKNVS